MSRHFSKTELNLTLNPFACKKKPSKTPDTTKWIGKRIRISVSISSNLLKEPISLWNSDSHHLVTSSIVALDSLAIQSKTILKTFFFVIETTIRVKLDSILEKLTQRHNRRKQAGLHDSEKET